MTDLSRRGFLAAAGGTVAGAWLAADAGKLLEAGAHAAAAVRAAHDGATPALLYLTAAQAADLDAAASQIIPTDDTPGAHEAGVVYFIDKSLATFAADQRAAITSGLAELHARVAKAGATQEGAPRVKRTVPSAALFAALASDQQREIIASLERDKHPFFFELRGATITGLLANPEYGGNVDKTGWKLIGFVDRFSWAPPFGWYDAHA
ncbi:MAG TPA: gluconate 2-dehydrogenase subunit 3 family protein [Gemmatimonadaceae bacterium]|nr:gluconate 2-dehydrogenase subunit 3 family protein [Gemmatimonadaceae bacterium]